MKVLFFSSSSNFYEGKNISSRYLPFCSREIEKLKKNFPEIDIILAFSLPGMFFFDIKGSEIEKKADCAQYHVIPYDDEKEIAAFLFSLKPDFAFACSSYAPPFDWMGIKDALVAQYLEESGVPVICNPLNLAVDCFDKWRTHQLLEKGGFLCPKAVYVHHELYINAGNRREIKSNVYKKSVHAQIEDLHFPVVVKDTVGLSSYGMDVLENFSQIHDWLNSKKFTSDRVIEQYIEGCHFGTEIYGVPGNYKVRPPFIFSVNKYGITSPKQSIKAGPVQSSKYKIDALNSILLKLAEFIQLKGIAQVDLVFDGENWFIIEINPRLSGMTSCYAAMENKTVPELILECAGDKFYNEKCCNEKCGKQYVLNIKFPLLPEEKLLEMEKLPFINRIYQIENFAAKQLREKGYCEVLVTGKSNSELKKNLLYLAENFKSEMEMCFFDKAMELLKKIEADDNEKSKNYGS